MRKLKITKTRNDRYIVESFIGSRLIKVIYVNKIQMIQLRTSGLNCEFGNMSK